jgi:hypothetical protein
MLVQLIREVIANHTGNTLPEVPPRVAAAAFGAVALGERVDLLRALPSLSSHDGVPAFKPGTMESYGQPCVAYLSLSSAVTLVHCLMWAAQNGASHVWSAHKNRLGALSRVLFCFAAGLLCFCAVGAGTE